MKKKVKYFILLVMIIPILFLACKPPEEIDDDPPAEVTNLSATVGDRMITLTWTNPTDEDFDKVEISGDLIYTVYLEEGEEELIINNCHNRISYVITVKTIDDKANVSNGKSVSATPDGSSISPHIGLCQDIADNWAGVFLNYDTPSQFVDECNLVKNYADDMEMIQEVRPFVNDGHFYIGMEVGDPLNDYDNIKIIPIVVTEANNEQIVIAKSQDHLRAVGLEEGNVITKINGTDIYVYLNQLMEQFPQSSEYESKEKATRILFTTARNVNNEDHYFETPHLDGSEPLNIEYKDTQTGNIDNAYVTWENLSDYDASDMLDTSLSDYWSIQRYYDVQPSDECISNNEFATLYEINGEKWLIYHTMSFLNWDWTDSCYMQFKDEADYFVHDLRDSVGGNAGSVNSMLYMIGVDDTFNVSLDMKSYSNGSLYSWGTMGLYPDSYGAEQLDPSVPVYIWPNAIAGSACDLYLYAVTESRKPPYNNSNNITIVGKPSAGRVQAISHGYYQNFDITYPYIQIYDTNDEQLEGRPILPDYPFDVDPEYYESPDMIFEEFVDFVKNEIK
jgi:hypothetical protein